MLRYQHTEAAHLIARLTARNEHLLALRIAEFLDRPPDAVLKHWACAKIAKSGRAKGQPTSSINLTIHAHWLDITGEETDVAPDAADAEVCRTIVDKFRSTPGASFADIARRAWELGRGRLATMVRSFPTF